MRIVVVGGVAAGMSAAARARRLAHDAEIVVLEKGEHVSFANCGLPYHVGEEIEERSSLLLHTPQTLRAALDLDVRTGHEVTAIDPGDRTVTVAAATGSYTLGYDALVLAPGATAVRPPIEGLDLPQVRTLRTVPDADALRDLVSDGARRAVVLGAGFIGLEAAEALRLRGLEVDVVELAPHVLPPLDAELAALVDAELAAHGVRTLTGVAADRVTATPGAGAAVEVGLADGTTLPADLVVLAVGVRPDSTLARAAGLEVDDRGAIVVDDAQRTSDPHIWAAGDATSVRHAVTGALGPVPLAGPANRQGRRAADAILGRLTPGRSARGVLGTAVVRVFGLTAALTGANRRTLEQAGTPHHAVHLHPGHHAGYFPGAEQVHLLMTFAPDGRVLGAQAVARAGADKRIDVLATAIAAGMTVDDVAELELAYAPPYGSAKDPVNMAGFMAQNVLDGTLRLWHADQLDDVRDEALVLDVRSPEEFASGHLPGALNVPHTELRDRLDEVRRTAGDRPVRVHCASGFRSYLAHRALDQAGLDSANLSGGMLTLRAARPDLVLERGTD
ncbi:FAD-dependent oxidoreductase [Cellulomonas bogoriensis]|uniref:Pyridine nucleotide-disulfide oxidoreductase n=1 Tax=Cellulomonas bogoriensis 69B4 = DSM 16987 TaxID=1386082 RepID=A0A0A0BQM8_9CELL|nr:FAD-dependent oxidoreductase [Cellulomonas bogoriensis]KGM10763.1 pyridine nucleotide-disulfide oxidoreductase [Cellulomonas bogoriensis 69B4 = DSM 16987]